MEIATSNSDGYALISNGEVWAWGVASYGELGNGEQPAYSTRAVKVEFPGSVRIVSLANPMPFGPPSEIWKTPSSKGRHS
jgi:alpha-tubulin suppressor-like RCC1 family protein